MRPKKQLKGNPDLLRNFQVKKPIMDVTLERAIATEEVMLSGKQTEDMEHILICLYPLF